MAESKIKVFEFVNAKFLTLANKIQERYSKHYNENLRKKLNNTDFSLFSPNCYAGIIYHRLGLQFKSPTINLLFPIKKQYLKFLENLEYYLSLSPVQITDDNYDCPVAMIDDVKIVFNHTKTFEKAKNDWEKRKLRVNYNNLFFMFDDIADAEYEDLVKFNKLKSRGKVIFTAQEYDSLDNAVLIKKYKKRGRLEAYLLDKNIFTGKNPADKSFDFVSWLNQ